MTRYPIIFGLQDRVEGDGFIARVATEGRALLHEEDDGYVWVEGVNPGGFVATGNSVAEALAEFRRSYTAILFDIASDATTFDEFDRRVHAFFDGAGSAAAREWDEAVSEVRAGRVSAEWLTKRSADSPRGVQVGRINRPSVQNNKVEAGTAIAA